MQLFSGKFSAKSIASGIPEGFLEDGTVDGKEELLHISA
jgi:hypothetical protein